MAAEMHIAKLSAKLTRADTSHSDVHCTVCAKITAKQIKILYTIYYITIL